MTTHELGRRLSVAGGGRPARFHHEPRSHTVTDVDLPARLEAVLAERFTEPVSPFSEMRVREEGPDGWPASYSVGPSRVAEVLRELLGAAPASSAVPAPATDRAALRERIAEILTPFFANFSDDDTARVNAGEAATALAAVLPAPADRAAALTEVADRYQGFIDNADTSADPRYWTGIRDMVIGLRHIAAESADETPQPTAPARVCRYCPEPSCPEDCPECGAPIHDLDAVPAQPAKEA
jgi:hypothetical protein